MQWCSYDEEVRIEVTSVVPMSMCVFKTKVNVEEGSMYTSLHCNCWPLMRLGSPD